MVWDFAESNPLGGSSGDVLWALDTMTRVLDEYDPGMLPAVVDRGTASQLIYADATFDAVVTDPPYYDSVTYSNLSDFFYVWLKRTVGHYYPEHFAASLTPKRNEAIAAFYRHNNNRKKAQEFYESALAQSLGEAHRVLRPHSPLIMIYAHKTTAGWATLIQAMRFARFEITEARPLETELQGGLRLNKAMLASSIFLVARRRENDEVGAYESNVRPELRKHRPRAGRNSVGQRHHGRRPRHRLRGGWAARFHALCARGIRQRRRSPRRKIPR